MKRIASAAAALLLATGAAAPLAAEDMAVVHTFDGSFEDAAFAVESAIVGRGLVIDYVSHTGEMLNRTAADVGSDVTLFEAADVYLFCSAVISRRVMEAISRSEAQVRTPITDGSVGKPWVFRPKDLRSWWSNPHHDRPGGVESGTPTAWVPQSKPIRFTEAGCPAIDRGTNQPNAARPGSVGRSRTGHSPRGGDAAGRLLPKADEACPETQAGACSAATFFRKTQAARYGPTAAVARRAARRGERLLVARMLTSRIRGRKPTAKPMPRAMVLADAERSTVLALIGSVFAPPCLPPKPVVISRRTGRETPHGTEARLGDR